MEGQVAVHPKFIFSLWGFHVGYNKGRDRERERERERDHYQVHKIYITRSHPKTNIGLPIFAPNQRLMLS